MENCSIFYNQDDHIDLPPGFRFHPTDEELITHYLSKKVVDSSFTASAIGDVDLNKCEPWDLPWRAKMGEKQWYFFCVRDRKYPTGSRTNRATGAGYWKATGKDKEIYRAKTLVGMKKTLVFYRGRAPKGEKTNWVMHEFRLEGKYSLYNLPKQEKNEWVISRVFEKSSSGTKTQFSGLVRIGSFREELGSGLPPLVDSLYSSKNNPHHVTCISSAMENQVKEEGSEISGFLQSPLFPTSTPETSMLFSKYQLPSLFYTAQGSSSLGNLQSQDSIFIQDQAFLRAFIESYGTNLKQKGKSERDMVSVSQETGLSSDVNAEISSVVSNQGRRAYEETEGPSVGPVDLDCLWNY